MNKYEILSCISLLYIQRLEFTLSPFERIVFFRLFLTFGYKRFQKNSIKKIALKIDIHHSKLEEAFSKLLEKFILVADDNDYIGVNRGYLKQLNKQKKIKNRIKSLQKQPRLDFLLQLFGKLFQIKISHKQKKSQQLLDMDYKQWLVLINLVLLSNREGVVLGAGTHELTNFTGLSRFALLRCMAYFFKQGILRSKIDGTLNNNYLNFVSSIYFINLSHSIWGDKRVFGRYLIFNHPQQTPVLRQLLEFLNDWELNESIGHVQLTQFILDSFQEADEGAGNVLIESEEYLISDIIETGRLGNTNFHKEFKLSSGYATGQKKLLLNSGELNFKRLDYFFCYLASNYPLKPFITFSPQTHLLPNNIKIILLELCRKVLATKEMEKKSDALSTQLSEIMTSQNELKLEIMSLLIQYVYQNELSHILDALAKITGKKYYNKVVPIGCSDELLTHKIYFSPDPHLEQNELFFIQYTETNITDSQICRFSGSKIIKNYKRSIQKMDLDLEKQLELGLLNQNCLGED